MSFFTVTHNLDKAARAIQQAARRFPKSLAEGIAAWQREIERDLESSTQTWKHDVTFHVKTLVQGSHVIGTVGTYDRVFGFVDEGTGLWGPKRAKYPIRPKRPGGVLVFQAGYRAKTIPGRIRSVSGGSFGETVYSRGVMHPGIQPRHILATVLDVAKHKLPRFLSKHLNPRAWVRVRK